MEAYFSSGVPAKKFTVPSIIISLNLIFCFLHFICTSLTARLVASFKAALKPISSSSSFETQPKPIIAELLEISTDSFSLCFFERAFESVSPLILAPFKTQAPTTKGPAHAPRPTSSIPRTILFPKYMKITIRISF